MFRNAFFKHGEHIRISFLQIANCIFIEHVIGHKRQFVLYIYQRLLGRAIRLQNLIEHGSHSDAQCIAERADNAIRIINHIRDAWRRRYHRYRRHSIVRLNVSFNRIEILHELGTAVRYKAHACGFSFYRPADGKIVLGHLIYGGAGFLSILSVHFGELLFACRSQLVVKDDFEGDLLAMDDKKYTIKKGDLVVTSDNKPVCLAGIMTTKEAEVTESSKNIVVESAIFYGAQIRRTSIRLGLTSDSAQRFIKGLNPNQNEDVLNLIENLMKNIANYDECSKTILYDVQNYKDKEIPCTFSYINNRLGTNFPNDVIVNTLSKLYFKINNVTKDGFVAVVPSFRIDVDGKAELSEEILRFNGFDSINSILPYMETTVDGRNSKSKKEKIMADYLLERGLYRIVTYNLLSKEDIGTFNLLNKNDGYVIMNPITEDHKYIRTNLLSSIVRTIQYNLNHQNKNFGVFEIAQIDDKKEVSIHLSLGLCGNKFSQDMMGAQAYSFYDAKGILESILTMFNIQSTRVKYDRIVDSKELHPNRSCKVTLDGKLLAVIGDIYPTLKDKYDMKKEAVVLLEMNLSLLFNTRTGDDHYVELNKFPSVSRDYAFIFDKSTKYADVKNEIKKLSTFISDVHIFDIYEGEHLVKDKVSIAMNVTFEAKDHTLKDEEVNSVDGKIKSLLLSKFNAIMRI